MLPFGVRIWFGTKGDIAARVWHRAEAPSGTLRFGANTVDAAVMLAERRRSPSTGDSRTGREATAAALRLRPTGILSTEPPGHMQIPVLLVERDATLVENALMLADSIVDNGLAAYFRELQRKVALPWRGRDESAAVHACLRLIMERAGWQLSRSVPGAFKPSPAKYETVWVMDRTLARSLDLTAQQ